MEPMILDSQRFGAWCHVRRIGCSKSQGRRVVFEDRGDRADTITKRQFKNCIDFKKKSSKVNKGTHSHAEADVFTFHGGEADVLDLLQFPKHRNITERDDKSTARTD